MTGILLRLLIYAIILGAIYAGVRRIFGDWRKRFQDLDKEDHERDLRERQRPDVIELKRDNDGVFRPGGKGGQGKSGADKGGPRKGG